MHTILDELLEDRGSILVHGRHGHLGFVRRVAENEVRGGSAEVKFPGEEIQHPQ